MKKCKSCNCVLDKIGTVEQGPNSELGFYNGVENAVFFILLSIVITAPYWDKHLYLSIFLISLFSALGTYLWTRPKSLYKCSSCKQMYYGNMFLNFYDN